MSKLFEFFSGVGETETTLYHTCLTLLSVDKRDIENTPALKTAYTYCLAYLTSRELPDGRCLIDDLRENLISEDDLTERVQKEIEQAIVSVTITDMVNDGLIESHMDESGEFTFTLTEAGSKLASEIKKKK